MPVARTHSPRSRVSSSTSKPRDSLIHTGADRARIASPIDAPSRGGFAGWGGGCGRDGGDGGADRVLRRAYPHGGAGREVEPLRGVARHLHPNVAVVHDELDAHFETEP